MQEEEEISRKITIMKVETMVMGQEQAVSTPGMKSFLWEKATHAPSTLLYVY